MTTIDKDLLQKRFSRRADTYDVNARVQKTMARALLGQTLAHVTGAGRAPTQVLEIGCGTGYFTRALLDALPGAHLTAVDLSPTMIEVARAHVEGRGVAFVCGDIEAMPVRGPFDLIVSNATFQWLNEFDATLRSLCGLLTYEGALCFSTFGAMTFHELHTSFRIAADALGLYDAPAPGQRLPGFEALRARCTAVATVTAASERFEVDYFPSAREFLRSIQSIGATNASMHRGCARPSLFRELLRNYELRFGQGASVPATYHCMYYALRR